MGSPLNSKGIGRSSLTVLAFVLLASLSWSPAVATGSEPAPPRTRILEFDRGSSVILTRRSLVEFRFRSDSPADGLECSLDRRPWRGCGRGVFRRFIDPGRHRFRVRAVAPDGTADATPAIRRWKVENWRPDTRAAARYARGRQGRTAFAVDIGWRSWSRGVGARPRMASTVKAMLMVAYLNMGDVRDRRLVAYEKGLIAPMIRSSDNDAANAIAMVVGPARMLALARRAGLRGFEYSTTWGLSRTTAADQARFMRAAPNLIPDRHRAWAMGLLNRIEGYQRWGVPKVRPRGWKLFFKGGWGISDGTLGGTVNHQIALLTRDELRIGVAILTEGNPWTSYGEKTLREVARRLLRGLPRVRGR